MRLANILLVSILTVLVRNSWTLCPSFFVQLGTRCYGFLISPELNWGTAYYQCHLHSNGYLAEIESEEEQYYITDYIQSDLDPNQLLSWWIGATDVVTEGRFQWMTSGNDLTYTNWGPDEPNNLYAEDCIYMSSGLFKWTDFPCNATRSSDGKGYVAICEADPI